MDFVRRKNASLTAAAGACKLCNFISICGCKEAGGGCRPGVRVGEVPPIKSAAHTPTTHFFSPPFTRPATQHSTLTPRLRIQMTAKLYWLNYFSIIWFATFFKMAAKNAVGPCNNGMHWLSSSLYFDLIIILWQLRISRASKERFVGRWF